MSWDRRSYEEEIMDDLAIHGMELDKTLRELNRINTLLGGFGNLITRVVETAQNAQKKDVVIVDLGCGSGWLIQQIQNRIPPSNNRNYRFIGVDANPNIVQWASNKNPSVEFVCASAEKYIDELNPQQSYIVVSSLFYHHFKDEEIATMLEKLRILGCWVFINDLRRSRTALILFKLLSIALRLSPMSRHDGALSIRRGFVDSDWKNIVNRAGFRKYVLKQQWAFRHHIELTSV